MGLKAEILNTDALLKAVDPERSALFRFPYGARNREGMQMLENAHLKSVMWNIDSLDWADPVPSSIAERVLRSVDKEGRGIILFHDIHERTVKALPAILDRLSAEGYQFAGWDGQTFKTSGQAAPAPVARAAATGYANSWAIVVGIDKYQKWPQLQYAVRDAEGVGQLLVQKFGFAPERVLTLKNEQATRTGILAAFHDRLAHGKLQPNDRLFVFFAGHGATRKLSSGRDLGYIVPVDADPDKLATDAIPMTEIQNIAESLPAKHALFVMDACYSGLGLTRGAANGIFLRDNARRLGRQMLTAGGTDQLVSDGGPNGHSVFTWTLLQALGRQGRPEWRRPDHGHRAGGLCGAGGVERVAADAGLRQPAGFRRRRIRVRTAGRKRVPEYRHHPALERCDCPEYQARCEGAGGDGGGERPAGWRNAPHGAGRAAGIGPPEGPACERPGPAAVQGKAVRAGRGAVHRSAQIAAELCAGGEQPRLRVLSAGEVSRRRRAGSRMRSRWTRRGRSPT